MKMTIVFGLCLFFCGGSVFAQPPGFDPARIDTPSQFYTNGVQVDAWDRDDAQNQIVTFWFGKNPKDSLSYRQLLAIRRDADPGKIYYFDMVGRKFVGRYDMAKKMYSLLEQQHRLERLEDIQEDWFPPPGEKPAIGKLFDPVDQGPANDEQLMMPPVTMEFPRLKESDWKGFYVDLGNRRRKMNLTFNGRNGSYQAADGSVSGDLKNVQYKMQANALAIQGTWTAGNTSGGFEFRIMMMDLNQFQGEYWVGNDRGHANLWDGTRTSR